MAHKHQTVPVRRRSFSFFLLLQLRRHHLVLKILFGWSKGVGVNIVMFSGNDDDKYGLGSHFWGTQSFFFFSV